MSFLMAQILSLTSFSVSTVNEPERSAFFRNSAIILLTEGEFCRKSLRFLPNSMILLSRKSSRSRLLRISSICSAVSCTRLVFGPLIVTSVSFCLNFPVQVNNVLKDNVYHKTEVFYVVNVLISIRSRLFAAKYLRNLNETDIFKLSATDFRFA